MYATIRYFVNFILGVDLHNMRLQRIFVLLTLLLTLLVSAQVFHTLSEALVQLRRGADGLVAMKALQAVLVASEMASRERGPANGVLGDPLPHDNNKLALLAGARQKTDQALLELELAIPATAGANSVGLILGKVRQQLAQARQSVDQVSAEPLASRSSDQIRSAISRMFLVVDAFAPATLRLTHDFQATYPKESNLLAAARLAADLREQAGRLGSNFTVTLAKRERIEPQEYLAVVQLVGRIDQLRVALLERVHAVEGSASIQKAAVVMQHDYFGLALPYVQDQLQVGLKDARFSTDTAGFAARYVPDMDSIIGLRDALIVKALHDAYQEQTEMRQGAYLTIAWTLASVALLVGMLLLLRYRIIQPLRQAIRWILDVAHGKLDIEIPQRPYRDEIDEVHNAIIVLRDNSRARINLEEERQQLLAELKAQAVTDFLTGLHNRRGFFELAEPLFTTLRRQGEPVAVIAFDIDHFKRVNDIYGHDAGDEVLKQVASMCRLNVRSGDILARLGGEEFALLLPYCDQEGALRKAEQQRRCIEQLSIVLSSGETMKVTASFGVDLCLGTDQSLHEVLKRCDDKLYQAKGTGRNKVV